METKLTQNFDLEEFKCPCGCGSMPNPHDTNFCKLVDMLQKARDMGDFPFYINSGYRCKKHNKKVGGVADSAHLKGWAVDVTVADSKMRLLMVRQLLCAGFDRLEICSTWIHVDVDPTKPLGMFFGEEKIIKKKVANC